jgi:hypothetical protein
MSSMVASGNALNRIWAMLLASGLVIAPVFRRTAFTLIGVRDNSHGGISGLSRNGVSDSGRSCRNGSAALPHGTLTVSRTLARAPQPQEGPTVFFFFALSRSRSASKRCVAAAPRLLLAAGASGRYLISSSLVRIDWMSTASESSTAGSSECVSFDSSNSGNAQSQVKEMELAPRTGDDGDDEDAVDAVDEHREEGGGVKVVTRRTVLTAAARATVQTLGPAHVMRSSGNWLRSTALRTGAVILYLRQYEEQ